MSIIWFNEKTKDCVATIADSNITLNKPALTFVEHAYNVMLGLNLDEKKVYIKPITKERCFRGDLNEDELHNITIRSSYARISNKSFINEIKKILGVTTLDNATKKFSATWNENINGLVIDLDKEVLR